MYTLLNFLLVVLLSVTALMSVMGPSPQYNNNDDDDDKTTTTTTRAYPPAVHLVEFFIGLPTVIVLMSVMGSSPQYSNNNDDDDDKTTTTTRAYPPVVHLVEFFIGRFTACHSADVSDGVQPTVLPPSVVLGQSVVPPSLDVQRSDVESVAIAPFKQVVRHTCTPFEELRNQFRGLVVKAAALRAADSGSNPRFPRRGFIGSSHTGELKRISLQQNIFDCHSFPWL